MSSQRSLLFDRWPRFAAHHPWRVLAAGLAVIIVLIIASSTAGGRFVDSFSIPGAESQQAYDLLNDRFPQQAGDTATVVLRSADGFDAPETEAAVEELIADFSELPDVVSVSSPYEGSGLISDDGTIARMEVRYDLRAFEIEEGVVDALFELREELSTGNLQVELTGLVAFVGEQEEPGQSELIGLIAAAIILLIAFGSVVAMGLPIITALGGLIPGFMIIGIASRFVDMASFTPQFASMIGIGVGIDYALLIVTRFREAKGGGMEIDDAIVTSMRTAGRAVLFAGSIVVLALLGLWSSGIPFIGWIATAAAIIVAILVIVALVLLPAILALMGTAYRPPLGAAAHPPPRRCRRRRGRAPVEPPHPTLSGCLLHPLSRCDAYPQQSNTWHAAGISRRQLKPRDGDDAPCLRPALRGFRTRIQRTHLDRHGRAKRDGRRHGKGPSCPPFPR